MNIRLVAGELLLDPNRVRYIPIHVDVEVSISTFLTRSLTSSLKLPSAQDPRKTEGASLFQHIWQLGSSTTSWVHYTAYLLELTKCVPGNGGHESMQFPYFTQTLMLFKAA
jgi:hypothetical protein